MINEVKDMIRTNHRQHPRNRLMIFLITITTLLVIWALNFAMNDLPPCLNEEPMAVPCFWDASERGNGIGDSVIIYPNGSTEKVN